MNDFFDLPEDSISDKKSSGGYTKKVDENIYDPDPSVAKGGVYKSVLRFLPNLKDKKLSKYTKYGAKIYNPLTKKAVYVDCPSNEGKPSIIWDLDKIKRRLYKEEPEVYQKINENFSRWYTHHSYVYVKRDLQKPDLEHTVKIFKYRAQINDLIEQMMNPDEDGLIDAVKKVNPFHLLEGRDFVCVVSKKTKTFRDWTKCKFMDDDVPFMFTVGEKTHKVSADEQSIKLVSEFFDKKAPSMEPYMHQPWTEETYRDVAEAIKAAVPYPEVIRMLIEETRDEKMKALLSGTSSTAATPAPSVSSIDQDPMGDMSVDFSEAKSEPAAEVESSSSSSLEEDEYDDLFSGM